LAILLLATGVVRLLSISASNSVSEKLASVRDIFINKFFSTKNMTLKICSKCHENQALQNYYIDRKSRDGHRGSCKSCDKITRHEKYEENKNKELNQMKVWRRNNPCYFEEWRNEHPDYFKNWYREKKSKVSLI
jgi:hypothetical protein